MWSNIEGTIDGNIISTGAAAIINNQFKTTDPKNIPKILYDLAGDKNLVEAGLIQGATKKKQLDRDLEQEMFL